MTLARSCEQRSPGQNSVYIDNTKLYNKTRFFQLTVPWVFRFNQSAIRLVYVPVLIMASYAGLVAAYNYYYSKHALPVSVVPFISVVLGLLLVFRSNTAYDRYYEGRRLWTDIRTQSRILVRNICIGIRDKCEQHVDEKKLAIRFIMAYTIAVKHHLRGEMGTDYEDFDGLLSEEFLRRVKSQSYTRNPATPIASSSPIEFDPAAAADLAESGATAIAVGSERPHNEDAPFSLTMATTFIQDSLPDVINDENMNLPLHVMCEIARYIESACEGSRMVPQLYGNILSNLNTLVVAMAGCERIVSTPIPRNYSIHLKQSVYIYLLILPWCILELHPIMVVMVEMITSFLLIGIEGIGVEIENPFGYDRNDLPLDSFCHSLRQELALILRYYIRAGTSNTQIPVDDDLLVI